MARIEKRKNSKAEVQGSYLLTFLKGYQVFSAENENENLQEYRKKDLLEKEISFLSLSPPFLSLFHVRT